jgi:hypothetical protein
MSYPDKSFEDIFEKYIASIAKEVIVVSYDPIKGEQTTLYHPGTHTVQADRSAHLGNLLRKYLTFYAYSENEILDKERLGRLGDLEAAAVQALQQRIPDRSGPTNGIYGEAFIDLLLYLKFPGVKKFCLRTVLRQRTDNNELKGFDALHIVIGNGQKTLMLGQAKVGGRSYCISSIKEDLKKTDFFYTFDELAFVVDKTGYVTQEVKDELDSFNQLFYEISDEPPDTKKSKIRSFLENNGYKIVIPCLLTYQKAKVYDDVDKKIIEEVKSIVKSLDDVKASIDFCDYEIVFLVFPIEDIASFRKAVGIDE